MGFNITFRRRLEDPPPDPAKPPVNGTCLIDPNLYLFTIVAVPFRRANDHYAWGMLNDGRLGFINCKWLIEVRDGDV